MNYNGKALTIAGSDSGGGAGVQADLKTFHSFDVFGMSVLTSITAQNTLGVHAIYNLPTGIIAAQIDSIIEDIGVDAIKTGMVSTKEIIETIVERVKKYEIGPLVVDPVIVSKSGDRLLKKDAETSLIKNLLPAAFLVTPNVPEAEIIGDTQIITLEDAKDAAKSIQEKGPEYVLLKGGHLHEKKAIDILFDGSTYNYFEAEKIDTQNTHGTGCTLSAAITACLANKMSVHNAIETAKDYITRAIRNAPDNIGKGSGPIYHKIEPLKASAFKEAARDFDAWFEKNKTVFQSELLAEKELISHPENAVSIGVGSGLFASNLGIKYGVEPAVGMAKLARKRGIKVKIGSAEAVPYPNEKFDMVLLSTVLSYVNDAQKAIDEAYRILKPGGQVIISFIAKEGSYAMLYDLAYLHGSHDSTISPPHPYPIQFIKGAKWLTTAEVTAMLKKTGFSDFHYVQTLRRHPKYTNEEVETPVEGYKEGDFIVVRGSKQ
jgi:hydroxymethylpyrimidine/phosphomethylpyrimidine kinase